jgi:hypothetical protein
MPADAFDAGIADMRDNVLAGHSNFRVFSKDSEQHVWLLFEPETVASGTKLLSTWLAEMFDPGSDWKSVSAP